MESIFRATGTDADRHFHKTAKQNRKMGNRLEKVVQQLATEAHTLRAKGIALVLSGAVLWGVSGTIAQYLFQHLQMDMQWLTVMRLLVSGLLLLGFCYGRERNRVTGVWKDPASRRDLIFFCGFRHARRPIHLFCRYPVRQCSNSNHFAKPRVCHCAMFSGRPIQENAWSAYVICRLSCSCRNIFACHTRQFYDAVHFGKSTFLGYFNGFDRCFLHAPAN